MCDEAKLAHWAKEGLTRRQFGAVGAAGMAAACTPMAGEGEASVSLPALKEDSVSFATADGTLDGFFVAPVTGAVPGVIFWPDIAGLREAKRNMARRLAGQGYAVLVVNPYYRDVTGEQFADFATFAANEGFSKVRPWRDKLSSYAIQRDTRSIVEWLDARSEVDSMRGIGTQGYCMGGPFTVYSAHAAPERVKAAASFHGGGLVRDDDQSPHRLLAESEASYLFAIAQDDDADAPDHKTILREAAADADRPAMVDVFAGDHGWTVPDSPAYDETAAERAYAELLTLYGDTLS